MSVQTIVLYGERLFDAVTYSTNQDPESLSVSLSDSTTLADTGITDAINKALADAIAAADSRITAVGTKPLSDSSTLTDTIAKALAHTLSAESVTLSEVQVNHPNKALPPLPTTTAGFPLFGALNYTGSQYGFNADGVYDGMVVLLESIVKFVTAKPLSDSSTLSETIAKAVTLASKTESVALGESSSKQVNKALPGEPTTTSGFPIYGALNYTASQYGFNADGLRDGVIILLEAVVEFLIAKAFTESLTMTEQRIFSATLALADGMLLADTSVRLTQIKGFSDFVLVKDWLELRLQRVNIWQSTQAFNVRPSQIHLYGPGVYYGFDFYGSNPSVNWLLEVPSVATWQTQTQTMGEEPLYAVALFGQSPFGSIPAVGWTNPPSASKQAWTNNNGESHN